MVICHEIYSLRNEWICPLDENHPYLYVPCADKIMPHKYPGLISCQILRIDWLFPQINCLIEDLISSLGLSYKRIRMNAEFREHV